MKCALIPILIGLLFVACGQIGPASVSRDRFDYNSAVSESWKEQTLLNIVKIRYADMPLFLEVASIVSGYSFEKSASLMGNIFEGGSSPDNFSLGAGGTHIERPTITYAPITGAKFNKNFMTPLPPYVVLFLIQSGWPADIVLPIAVEAVNGLRAQRSAGASQRVGDSGYYRVIQLFKTIQNSAGLGVRVIRNDENKETLVLSICGSDLPADVLAARDELAGLLGVQKGAGEYTVTFGEIAKNDKELAMLTRSMLSIMVVMAGQVEVPEWHISQGITVASLSGANASATDGPRHIIAIRHGRERPVEAFVAVEYKGYWFWIDDRDFASKRIFAYLMILFSLTETSGREGLPLITIPAG